MALPEILPELVPSLSGWRAFQIKQVVKEPGGGLDNERFAMVHGSIQDMGGFIF